MTEAGANWQLKFEKVEQRCHYLHKSGLRSDCTFVLGSEEPNQTKVPAHKLILAMASPVFEAMFYGGRSECNDPIIPIPDFQPDTFRALLQYIYTRNPNISSFEMARALWFGAKKYMLPHLVKECKSYICSVVDPKNACRAYEVALLFDEKILMDKCIQVIRTNTKEVLNDSSFVDVDLNTVTKVFSLDQLNVDSELDLFHAVAKYAKAKQMKQEQSISPPTGGGPPSEKLCQVLLNVESSSQNSTSVELDSKKNKDTSQLAGNENLKEEEPCIRSALEKIRFLTLTLKQFAAGPARSGLLTKNESYAVLMNIASRVSAEPMPTGFSKCRERRQQRIDSVDKDSAKSVFQPSSAVAATKMPAEIVRENSDFKWKGTGPRFIASGHFECTVPLPEKIVVRTGEEDEEKLFGERVKIYRYDNNNNEWKERGVGELKILHHPQNNTYRLLLRREQIHKAVLNMLLRADIQLLPMNIDRAWTFAGRNFAENPAGDYEVLAVRFRNIELACSFRDQVNQCLMVDEEPNAKPVLKSRTDSCAVAATKMLPAEIVREKSDSKGNEAGPSGHYECTVPLPDKIVVRTGEEDEEKLFGERVKIYRYDNNNNEWKERGVGELKILHHPQNNTYRLLLRREQIHKAVLNMLLRADIQLLPMNIDRAWTFAGRNFAENPAGDYEVLAVRFRNIELACSFRDQVNQCLMVDEEPNAKPVLKSRTDSCAVAATKMLPAEIVREKSDSKGNEAGPSGHYECTVPLPDKIVVRTGEEDEEKLFGERVKIYRFDNNNNEWKERGVGELKILHHPQNNTYRLLLRREQIHKAVLNMLLRADIQLLPMNIDRAWTFAGRNFAENPAGDYEMLAVRFRNIELACSFRDQVNQCLMEKLFGERVKIYRYDYNNREWKERGVGELKILHHPQNNTYRLLLRREQIHKVVLNMLLHADIKLNPMKHAEKAWAFAGKNFAENPAGDNEMLAVRFKNTDLTNSFRDHVNHCLKMIESAAAKAIRDEKEDKDTNETPATATLEQTKDNKTFQED